MPLPTTSSVHVDSLLTDFAIAYGQEMNSFIGDAAATIKRVQKQSDKYQIWDKADFFRSEMELVADGHPSPQSEPRMSTDTFFADVYKLKSFLTDEKMDAADDPDGLRRGLVRYLMLQAKLKREIVFATEIHATGKWTSVTEQTGVAAGPAANQFLQWNDTSSTPLEDLDTFRSSVRLACGLMPNTMTMDVKVADALTRHPDIVGRYQYVEGGAVSYEQLSQLVKMKVLVGQASKNTAVEGAAASLSAALGTGVLLHYQDDSGVSAGEAPTAVTGFAWSPYDQVDETGAAISTWRNDDPDGEFLRATMAIDYKITANDAGVYLATAVA